MVEKFLQWVWQKQLLKKEIITESGMKVEIIFPGRLNEEDGPDFKSAIIKFNNKIISGDVEIHNVSNDWIAHNHHSDPKYNNVILHVVVKDGKKVFTKSGIEVETISLSNCSSKPLLTLLKEYNRMLKTKDKCRLKDLSTLMSILKEQAENRFYKKRDKFSYLIKTYGNEQGIYIGIMESLGYTRNEEPFFTLANYIPISKIKDIVQDKYGEMRLKFIKSALLGVANLLTAHHPVDLSLVSIWKQIKKNFPELMRKEEWQFFKVMPMGSPPIRINKMAHFLFSTIDLGLYNSLMNDFTGFNKKLLDSFGKNWSNVIILNVCLPILSLIDPNAIKIYHNYKRLPKNSITNKMSMLFGIEKDLEYEIYYQGMIEIFHNYCYIKDCKNCPVKINS